MAPAEAQSQLQVLDYYLRSHSDHVFRSLSPSHFCLKTHTYVLSGFAPSSCASVGAFNTVQPELPLALRLRSLPLAPRAGCARAGSGDSSGDSTDTAPHARPPPPASSIARVRTPPLPAETAGASPAAAERGERRPRSAPRAALPDCPRRPRLHGGAAPSGPRGGKG